MPSSLLLDVEHGGVAAKQGRREGVPQLLGGTITDLCSPQDALPLPVDGVRVERSDSAEDKAFRIDRLHTPSSESGEEAPGLRRSPGCHAAVFSQTGCRIDAVRTCPVFVGPSLPLVQVRRTVTVPRSMSRSELECNGVAERFMRTLKEQCIYLHQFRTLEEARRLIGEFIARYNAEWLIERLGHRTPAQARVDAQRRAAWLDRGPAIGRRGP